MKQIDYDGHLQNTKLDEVGEKMYQSLLIFSQTLDFLCLGFQKVR